MTDPTHGHAPCLACCYLAAEAERQRVVAEVNARLAAARLVQGQALQSEVEILRALNENLTGRVAVAEALLARRAERN